MIETGKFESFTDTLRAVRQGTNIVPTTQMTCLGKYLSELKVASYVIEREYTDAGYLVDYANYYSRCHQSYERKTTRLHFFAADHAQLTQQLRNPYDKQIRDKMQENYRGFVVVKPLPQTIIGRTCLLTYPRHDEVTGRTREFPITRRYSVNLNGIPLELQSVAFQEQDSETAACATAAIWFALHGMPRKIAADEIPSPYDITKIGSSTYIERAIGDVTRHFPTGGLGLEQIESYLRKFELECIVCGLKQQSASGRIQEYMDSYLRAGYPMIVVGNMYVRHGEKGSYKHAGFHAVTALAYADVTRFVKGAAAQRIERLFAHDDNVGPFTSFRFEETTSIPSELSGWEDSDTCPSTSIPNANEIVKKVRGDIKPEVTTHWQYLANQSGLANEAITYRRILPRYLLIPINPKVRLPLEIVTQLATQIFNGFEKIKQQKYGAGQPTPQLSWSCRLKDVSKVKLELLEQSTIERDEYLLSMLAMPMPRYLWDVSFAEKAADGRPTALLQILIDATDLLQGGMIVSIVVHAKNPNAQVLDAFISCAIRDWIGPNLREQDLHVLPLLRSLGAIYGEIIAANLRDPA